jgi:Tfp pilus assembly protein PilP
LRRESFIGRFVEENKKDRRELTKKVSIVAAVFLLVIILLNTGCTQKEAVTEQPVMPEINEGIAVGNDGVKAGIAPDTPEPAGKTVAVTVANIGRPDPFVPDAGGFESGGHYISSDMIVPPENITASKEAETVITTKVTGILYDKSNPSAIINIGGSDYLVRSGDYINNYKVLSIGQTNVTVQLGNNIYKAGVGELFSKSGLNYNTISNLENKFGGAKK